MIPAASTALPVANGGQTAPSATAKPDATVTGQSKSSAGVPAPANARLETSNAVDPSRQATVAPRLRDQGNADRSNRSAPPPTDAPTGPPPSFEETPLQRAARVIFDPPEAYLEVNAKTQNPGVDDVDPALSEDVALEQVSPEVDGSRDSKADAAARAAEAAFEQARKIEAQETKGVDVAL